MSAQKRTVSGALGAFLGFVGMSAVAGLLVAAAVTPAIAVTSMSANGAINVFNGLPSYLKIDELAQATTLYAKNDKGKNVQLATFYAQNRHEVGWKDVSQATKDAAIAAEDPRFYEHGGVDLKGTVRGVLSTVLKHDVQGGSSITQQLVKNIRIENCVSTHTVPAAPDKSEVPDKPKKSDFKSDAKYATARQKYQRAHKSYERQLKVHDRAQKKYSDCLEDARGVTAQRKLQEMKMAIALEKKYSKDQILLKYLNISLFGGNVYGIQAAAKYYYGIDAKDLDVPQAASLLAIVNNPERYRLDEPKSDTNGEKNGYAANKSRRDYILRQMLKYKKITQDEFDKAIDTKITPKITPKVRGCQTAGNAAYFCDYITWVIKHDKAFGETAEERWANFERGGYTIYTTLDLDMQKKAKKYLSEYVPANFQGADLGGATTTVQPGTGRILTMAQSRKYSSNPTVLQKNPSYTAVNWNTDHDYGGSSGFQTGSAYKIFTLAQWLKAGHSLEEQVNGSVTHYDQASFTDSCGSWSGPYDPGNDSAGELGYRSALNATVYSVNTAYVAMGHELDLCKIAKTAEDFDVHRADGEALSTSPSSILGTNQIAPLSMATAFAAVANKGEVCTPIAIDKIVGPNGKKIDAPKSKCTQAVSPEVAASMAYALERVVSGGTAAGSNTGLGTDVLGKTGTTDDAEQAWLIESTTKAASAYWIGNVTGHVSMRHIWPAQGIRGDNTRLSFMRQMMTALIQKYGGDPFPSIEKKYLVGEQVTVPSLVGQSPADAQKLLQDAGLGYQQAGDTDSTLPKGQVAKTDPGSGATVAKGTVVKVYTSNGQSAKLPDVSGRSDDEARGILADAGFTQVTSVPRKTDDEGQNGKVIAMSPSAGSTVKRGQSVTLSIGVYTGGDDHDDHGGGTGAPSAPPSAPPEPPKPPKEGD